MGSLSPSKTLLWSGSKMVFGFTVSCLGPSTNTQHHLRLHLIIFVLNYNSTDRDSWAEYSGNRQSRVALSPQLRLTEGGMQRRIKQNPRQWCKISNAAIKSSTAAQKHSCIFVLGIHCSGETWHCVEYTSVSHARTSCSLNKSVQLLGNCHLPALTPETKQSQRR